jgi:RNA polymerase sigma-70 factor (ECF subfamily)
VTPEAEARALDAFRTQRSPAAFEALVDLHIDRVRSVIYSILLDQTDTDDVAQETFVAAYTNFDSFRGRSRFSTWLCGIAVKRALTFLRRRTRRRARTVGPEALDRVPADARREPERHAVANEEMAVLEAAIHRLPPHFRAVLLLSVVEDMDTGDVAKSCGCTRATVYWRLHRARALLREFLEERTRDGS